jgi:hypothetical protein
VIDELQSFVLDAKFYGKGPLCVALVVTDHARKNGLPLSSESLITEGEGQVLGLGRSKVQTILARYGITKTLASEGGRTSRGSIANMRSYVTFLNNIQLAKSVDIDAVEKFWIEKVKLHFSAKPFSIKVDPSLSIRAVVRSIISQAQLRQKDSSGSMIVGTVMQHLVGAKIELAMLGHDIKVEHHGSNQNDVKGRGGDFDLGDVSIHVTTAPGELLIAKCVDNLSRGLKPIIVTSGKGVAVAEALSENAGIGDRVDVLDFEQFFATNVHELGRFESTHRRKAVQDILERYNAVVSEYENDDSLKVDLK